MRRDTLDSLSLFFQRIQQNQNGFVVKKDHDLVFAQNKNQAFAYKMSQGESSGIEDRFLDIPGLDVSCHPLDEKSDEMVFVIGEPENLPEEYELLELLMEQTGILPDKDAISSILGILSPKEQKKNLPTYDFWNWIYEKTRNFVGRQNITDSVEDFIAKNRNGYCIISAKPGMGKTAFAANLVRKNDYLHHFNIRAEGINRTQYFLANICAQLILRYGLDYQDLPSEAAQNSNFLSKILGEISESILQPNNEKLIMVVDALDEVDDVGDSSGTNMLYLPNSLPDNVYIIATMRQDSPVQLQTICPSQTIKISPDSKENRQDILQYIKNQVKKEEIQNFMLSQKIDEETFTNHMLDKSEGNFIYLHYVLPDIEHGLYDDLGFEKIPKGLLQYYEQHWQIMKGRDENSWFEYKLPVLVALTVTKRPISVNLISKFSKVEQLSYITQVLTEWKQFLYEEENAPNSIQDKRYRLYHDDFHDFIASKDQVKSERVDLAKTERQIIDSLLPEGYGKEQTDN